LVQTIAESQVSEWCVVEAMVDSFTVTYEPDDKEGVHSSNRCSLG